MTADVAAEPAVLAPIEAYIAALNQHDIAGIRAAFHYPHVQLRAGKVEVYAAPSDVSYDGFYRRMAKQDWQRSTFDGHRVALAGPDKVHLDVWFTRWRRDGSAIGTHHSLYTVTRIDGRWGIQSNSSYG